VDTVNLAVQGFHEKEVGEPKVTAVAERLAAIDRNSPSSPTPKEAR